MTSTQHGSWFRHIGSRLLLVAMLTLPSSLLLAPPAADAAPANRLGGPIVGVVAAWIARNRVYRTAESYMDRQQDYYDRLHAKAQEQLRTRELGGLRTSQVAAYVKVVGLIERERAATIQFAEAEKAAAWKQFGERAERAVINVILSTNAATRVLGAMKDALSSSKGLVNRALDKLAGDAGGALAEVRHVRDTAAWVSVAGEMIGGRPGSQIRAAANGVVKAIDRPVTDMQEGLIELGENLDELGAMVGDLQDRGYLPSAGEVARDALISVVTGDAPDPAAEALVEVISRRAGQSGGDFRDRARAALAGNVVARCSAIGAQYRQILRMSLAQDGLPEDVFQELVRPPTCEVIDVEALARGEPGETPEEPQIAQASPIAQPAPTTQPASTVTPISTAQAPATVQPSPQTGEAPLDLDPCDLMPPGGRMTSTDDTYCRHAYADDPTLRAVQINRMGRPATPDHDFCRALETTYQFETALAEWPLGVCGFIFDRHHQGEKISGYTGWQIRFILDRFGVTVATKEEYPANKAWMESTAAQIEANIRSQMRPVAD